MSLTFDQYFPNSHINVGGITFDAAHVYALTKDNTGRFVLVGKLDTTPVEILAYDPTTGLITFANSTSTLLTATTLYAGNGTAVAPSIANSTSHGSGLFWNGGGNDLVITLGGTSVIRFFSTDVRLGSSERLGFASGTDPVNNAADILFTRLATNQLGLTSDGATSNTADLGSATVKLRSGYFGTGLGLGSVLTWSAATPTIFSGFGVTPSVTAGTATAFTVNVGTGGVASSGVIAMNATATTGWICHVNNQTAAAGHRADNTRQTASTTTTVTVENQTTSTGAAVAWAASDILTITATAY